MRRTGGTTFASLLSEVSSFPKLPHEPFNPDRKLGKIIADWNRTVNLDALRADISRALECRPVIKHCYEIVPLEVNSVLMQETAKKGYKTILLIRDDEVSRQFSLELALKTGAWSPKVAPEIFSEIRSGIRLRPKLNIQRSLSHLSDCFLRTLWVQSAMKKAGVDGVEISYESLYGEGVKGVQVINSILFELGFSERKVESLQQTIESFLLSGNQRSRSNEDLVENFE